MTEGSYTDPATDIQFKTWSTEGSSFTFGMALPSDALTTDATEYIGLIVSQEAARNGALRLHSIALRYYKRYVSRLLRYLAWPSRADDAGIAARHLGI